MGGFAVEHRNQGHWDIYQNNKRIYQIRGERGKCWVFKDLFCEPVFECKTVGTAMGYICDQLMYEEEE